MNKAKTLKRKLGNPEPFLSVAWDTDDIPSKVSVNPNSKWKDINWKRVEKNVCKLQNLIYRASSRGEIRKMRKYQRLLTKSYYARLIAVKHLTQDNQGRKTAGIDGIKSISPMQRFNLVDLLYTCHLKSSPTHRFWIPKLRRDKKPSLSIQTMHNRALQALVKLGMEPEWEAYFEPNSYGFRPGRSTHDAIEAIYGSIKQKPKYVLDANVSKCFDQINHDALLGKIGRSPYRQLVKQWLKSGVLDNKKFQGPLLFPSREGIEAGTIKGWTISPLLANIALHGMEKCLNNFAETLPGDKQANKYALSLIRYADDFVILHEDIKVVLQAKTVMQEWLNQLGLELKPEKTKIAHILQEYEGNKPGFDFLGFTIRQCQLESNEQGLKTLIKPSSKSIKAHYRKLTDICDSHKTVSTKTLIAKLNRVIRGWTKYFSTVVSKKVFKKLDHLLGKRLWRWGSRRHPNKPATWVRKKYFHSIGTRNWIFNNGKYILKQHSDIHNIRHIKVKGNKFTL